MGYLQAENEFIIAVLLHCGSCSNESLEGQRSQKRCSFFKVK